MRKVMSRSVATALALALMLVLARASVAENSRININTATASELMSLKGIGAAKSQAIVAYREQHGPFKTVEDLKAVSGIGDKLLEQLRPYITVGKSAGGGTAARR